MAEDLAMHVKADERELDRKEQLRSERVALLSELTKGLIAVNSGGAIALLAFVGAMAKDSVRSPMFLAFKSPALFAFWVFGAGVVASLFLPVFLLEHSIAVKRRHDKLAKRWFEASAVIAGVGFSGVILGIVAIAIGLDAGFSVNS